jgi:hypothetical protein
LERKKSFFEILKGSIEAGLTIDLIKRFKKVMGIILGVGFVIGFFIGLQPTMYGHLGPHPFIFEILPFFSCISPILALLTGVGFACGDMLFKGADTPFLTIPVEAFWFIQIGVLIYALLPGILSRVFMGFASNYVASRRTMYDGGGAIAGLAIQPLAVAASVAGAFIGTAIGTMAVIPALENFAFITYPPMVGRSPDVSCFALTSSQTISRNPLNNVPLDLAAAGGASISAILPIPIDTLVNFINNLISGKMPLPTTPPVVPPPTTPKPPTDSVPEPITRIEYEVRSGGPEWIADTGELVNPQNTVKQINEMVDDYRKRLHTLNQKRLKSTSEDEKEAIRKQMDTLTEETRKSMEPWDEALQRDRDRWFEEKKEEGFWNQPSWNLPAVILTRVQASITIGAGFSTEEQFVDKWGFGRCGDAHTWLNAKYKQRYGGELGAIQGEGSVFDHGASIAGPTVSSMEPYEAAQLIKDKKIDQLPEEWRKTKVYDAWRKETTTLEKWVKGWKKLEYSPSPR